MRFLRFLRFLRKKDILSLNRFVEKSKQKSGRVRRNGENGKRRYAYRVASPKKHPIGIDGIACSPTFIPPIEGISGMSELLEW